MIRSKKSSGESLTPAKGCCCAKHHRRAGGARSPCPLRPRRHRLGACLTGQPDRCRRDRAGYRIERTGRVDEPLVGAGVAHAERARPKEQAAGRRSGARGCSGSYGLTAVEAKSAPEVDQEVAQALVTVFGWAPHFSRIVSVGVFLFALVIVADVLVPPSVAPARDLDRPGPRRRGWSHPSSNRRRGVVPGRCSRLSNWGPAQADAFGGNIASELTYALALGATCLAYGVHLNLAQLVFVNTAASVLSSLIPVPGGIGAAEASLSAALIAMGVDEPTAFAIALTQRLCTFYLPPISIWGFVSLRWLSRKGYL